MESQPKQSEWRGAWIMLPWFAGDDLIARIAWMEPFHSMVYPSSAGLTRDQAHWWLSSPRQDVVAAYLSVGSLLWGLGVVAFAWRRYPQYASMALWMTCLFTIPKIIQGAYVQAHSRNLFDPARTELSWANFDEYFAAMHFYGRVEAVSMFGLIGIISIVALWRLNKTTARPKKAAATPAV